MDLRTQRFSENRDALTPDIPQDQYKGRVATDFQLRILEVGYWKNYVHTEGTPSQLQTVGWQWELGIRISDELSIFHEHHSRHRMDSAELDLDGDGKPNKFPVEDSYGIRLHFYVNPRPSRSIFGGF